MVTQQSGRLPRQPTFVVPLLWCFAFLSYVLRMNIAVAQQYMARELHFSDIQVGFLFSAFLIGYSLFQLPGGILGDRFGSRRVLAVTGLWCGVTTLLCGYVPGYLVSGTFGALLSLVALRLLYGLGQAFTYPVAMTGLSRWFPLSRHAVLTSLIFTGSTAGAAFAPPLVAGIMNAVGWRATFYWTGILPIVLALVWFLATRRISSDPAEGVARSTAAFRNWWPILRTRNVAMLCTSYFLYCYAISIYVYWLFKYLVDVRHLSIVNSGWATSLPWMAATLAVPIAGWISTRLTRSMSMLRARRLVAVVCLLAAAFLMYVGASASQMPVALAAIACSVALLFCTESPYWSTSIAVAQENAGASGGLLNLAGNLGGVAATSLVPVLAVHFGWLPALLSGSVAAVVGALTWFAIRE